MLLHLTVLLLLSPVVRDVGSLPAADIGSDYVVGQVVRLTRISPDIVLCVLVARGVCYCLSGAGHE